MKNETAHVRSVGGATWTATPGGYMSCTDYTTVGAYSQPERTPIPTWRESKQVADGCWPAVRSLLLSWGFSNPTPTGATLDRPGCDILAGGRRFGWRTRDRKYLKYGDITLRQGRPSGAFTECDKVRAGAVHYLVWTWAASYTVTDWLLLDAGKVRPLLDRRWPSKSVGDASFIAIPFRDLAGAGAVVQASRDVKRAMA